MSTRPTKISVLPLLGNLEHAGAHLPTSAHCSSQTVPCPTYLIDHFINDHAQLGVLVKKQLGRGLLAHHILQDGNDEPQDLTR